MNLKITGSLIAIFITAVAFASTYHADTLITVAGKAINEKDSSTISATVSYEKLPYYDDMGITRSQPDGSFELSLIQGTEYIIRVENNDGYEPYSENILVRNEGNLSMALLLKIKPVEDEELITLKNLTFNSGSAVIRNTSYASLDEFANYINSRTDVNIQLEGHTDFAGNADANMALSQARVEAVADYLAKKGVKKTRITIKAYGGSQPLSTDRTPEAIAINRRVEVRLIKINK